MKLHFNPFIFAEYNGVIFSEREREREEMEESVPIVSFSYSTTLDNIYYGNCKLSGTVIYF